MTYKIGQIIEGKVTGIQPYGAFVSLDNETQGLIHVSEVQSGYTKNIHSLLKVGQPVTVQIIDIDEYSKKISLSLRTLEKTNPAVPYRRKRYFTNKNRKIGFAGTIMLHLEDGTKKFLVHSIDDKLEFALAELSEGKTGLANILNFLKEIVHIDVSKISLMELTNTHIKEENVPLFVFETEQKNQREELGEGYIWEEPGQMRSVLGTYEVEGVPFF